MRALSLTRKRQNEISEKLEKGQCIIDGCTRPPRSRGLCSNCRQLYYYEVRHKRTEEDALKYEEECIAQGLILHPGEARLFTRRRTNPFARVAT